MQRISTYRHQKIHTVIPDTCTCMTVSPFRVLCRLSRLQTVHLYHTSQDIFDSWLTCQQKWMYLGPVYGSEEIAKQMPKERFEFQVNYLIYFFSVLAADGGPATFKQF